MTVTADLPGAVLPPLARAAIAARLGLGEPPAITALDARLLAPGASFVTLELADRLRGCVGSLEALRPLADDVRSNAVAAAFEDPRFPPLTEDELPGIGLEVSVLGPLVEIRARDQEELSPQLRPGVDGVVLAVGDRRATFLPQVWRSLPDPVEFVDHLRRKAGIGDDLWKLEPRFSLYRVRKWAG